MALFGRKPLKVGKTLIRYGVDVILGAIILSIVNMIITAFAGLGVLVSAIFTVIVVGIYVPFVFKIHKGSEPILDLIIGIILGTTTVGLVTALTGIQLPILAILGTTNLMGFLMGITSFWLADTIVLKVMKGR